MALTNNTASELDLTVTPGTFLQIHVLGADDSRVLENAPDPTGGGGAAVGRVPIKVGGSTFHFAYY